MADLKKEIRENLSSVTGMHNLRMELNGQHRAIAVGHRSHGTSLRSRQNFKTRGNGFHHIAVAHPHLALNVDAGE